MINEKIKVIAFDADDTLWDNQTLFDEVENQYCKILRAYGDEEFIRKSLLSTEIDNMPEMGYGTKAFILSLIQNALKVSQNTIPGPLVQEILRSGMDLLLNPATPLPEVTKTLIQLKASGKFKLVCFTKGELIVQENKFNRSELAPLFDHLEIVSDKSSSAYKNLCEKMNALPHEFVMVGNSFKSDIHPAIEIGAYGIYIPASSMWQMEQAKIYSHNNIIQVKTFADIAKVLL